MSTDPQAFWYLKNYDLFKGISERDIAKVSGEAVMKECDGPCMIYQPYEASQNIYIVKKGEVQLFYRRDGKKYVFDTLGPGSVFGNIEMGERPYGHFAEGKAGVCVCAFTSDMFLKLISAYPQVMLRYMRDMSSKIHEYQEQFQNNHASADEIVLHELQRLNQKRQQSFIGKMMDRPLRVTHAEMAQLTGLNRVTVTRSMKRLRDAGDVEYDASTGIINILA